MFAKLLKYEFKSSAKLLVPLSAAALGVGVVGACLLKFLVVSSDRIHGENSVMTVLMPACGLLLAGLCLALVAYMIGSWIALLIHFYKNKFTDEGYLTFTLPAGSHQVFASAFLNILFWYVLAAVVFLAGMTVILLFGTSPTEFVNTELLRACKVFFSGLRTILSEAFAGNGSFVLIQTVSAVVGTLSSIMLAMAAITVGAIVAQKHKILAALGVGYATQIGASILSSVLSVGKVLSASAREELLSPVGVLVPQIIPQLIILIGGYFLSTWLIEHKLNLP